MTDHADALSEAQISSFIADGFVGIDHAFSGEVAAACRDILWKAAGVDPERPETWTGPVIRLGGFSEAPFREAANSPVLVAAYDQLVGVGRWAPPMGLGTFPIRFPPLAGEAPVDAGDTGWHVDVSFAGEDASDPFGARVNIRSKGRALLMLFLFTEVGEADAPTRIKVGSHRVFARHIAGLGERGVSLRELVDEGYDWGGEMPVVMATGGVGTVYLCHPFLIHAAQVHRGTRPRIIAQPPLFPRGEFDVTGDAPVERAIGEALREGR
jgi:hypothetical protein